jgi:hypothetical protein
MRASPSSYRLLSLPQFEKCRGPQRHENGEEHRGGIVKEVRYLRIQTRLVELLIAACLIAQWTEGQLTYESLFIAHLLAGRVVVAVI